MKTLKFISYLLYRFYSRGGTKNIPYFSAVCALVLFTSMHILQLLVFFDCHALLHGIGNDTRPLRYLKIILLSSPVFLLFFYLIKENDLKNAEYPEKKVKLGAFLLVSYVIFSFALFLYLLTNVRPKTF
jgi:hypothetical protein